MASSRSQSPAAYSASHWLEFSRTPSGTLPNLLFRPQYSWLRAFLAANRTLPQECVDVAGGGVIRRNLSLGPSSLLRPLLQAKTVSATTRWDVRSRCPSIASVEDLVYEPLGIRKNLQSAVGRRGTPTSRRHEL